MKSYRCVKCGSDFSSNDDPPYCIACDCDVLMEEDDDERNDEED